MTEPDERSESPDAQQTQDSESSLSRAADMGPLPGIVDETDNDDDSRASEQERKPDAPIGQRPDDEVKEALGFMGVRST